MYEGLLPTDRVSDCDGVVVQEALGTRVHVWVPTLLQEALRVPSPDRVWDASQLQVPLCSAVLEGVGDATAGAVSEMVAVEVTAAERLGLRCGVALCTSVAVDDTEAEQVLA